MHHNKRDDNGSQALLVCVYGGLQPAASADMEVIPGTPDEEPKPGASGHGSAKLNRQDSHSLSFAPAAMDAPAGRAVSDHSNGAAARFDADHSGDSSLPAVSGLDSAAQCHSFAFAPGVAAAAAAVTPNLKFGGRKLPRRTGAEDAVEQGVQEEVRKSLAGTCSG